MEIKIDAIEVIVEDAELDVDQTIAQIKRHLEEALAQIAREKAPEQPTAIELETLYLPPVNWEEETDKTGKLVEMILQALSEQRFLY